MYHEPASIAISHPAGSHASHVTRLNYYNIHTHTNCSSSPKKKKKWKRMVNTLKSDDEKKGIRCTQKIWFNFFFCIKNTHFLHDMMSLNMNDVLNIAHVRLFRFVFCFSLHFACAMCICQLVSFKRMVQNYSEFQTHFVYGTPCPLHAISSNKTYEPTNKQTKKKKNVNRFNIEIGHGRSFMKIKKKKKNCAPFFSSKYIF